MTRIFAVLAATFGVISAAGPAAAESSFFYDVSPEEAALKDDPMLPGAPAIVLRREELTRDQFNPNTYGIVRTIDASVRIKVLTNEGRSYADVQIPYYTSSLTSATFESVEGRTLQSDGSQIVFDGKVHEKVLAKTEREALRAVAFSLPDVRAGSIVEYRYRLVMSCRQFFPSARWTLQHPLTTKSAVFSMYPARGPWKFTYAGSIPTHVGRPSGVDGGVWIELKDVPAIPDEPHMPPRDAISWRLDLFYDTQETLNAEEFWSRVAKGWGVGFEKFAKDRRRLRKEVDAVVGAETDPQKKIRALYRRVQEIRNLSYESDATKPRKIRDNDYAGDVLDNGYGNSEDITGLFVALARSAGFQADLIRVGDRRKGAFEPRIFDDQQLHSAVASVVVDGRELFLDPGTPMCPFGTLHWKKTGAQGVRVGNGGLDTIPLPAASTSTREGEFELESDGTLRGKATYTMMGQPALMWRTSLYRRDEAERSKTIGDSITGALPEGATAKVTAIEGWEEPESPLVVRFEVEAPGWAQVTSQRMLVSAELFDSREKNPFERATRTLPVVFEFPLTRTARIHLAVPAGWSIESLPASIVATGQAGRHHFSAQPKDAEVVIERELQLSAITIAPAQYSTIRSLYTSATTQPDRLVLRADTAPAP